MESKRLNNLIMVFVLVRFESEAPFRTKYSLVLRPVFRECVNLSMKLYEAYVVYLIRVISPDWLMTRSSSKIALSV